MPIITMVLPENIEAIWPQIIPLLQPALKIAETHNIHDVKDAIDFGKAQLWVQWNEGAVDAAVTTEIVNYPRGTWLRFWLAGAQPKTDILWDKFYESLYNFAKKHKFVGIEDCGRNGWSKYAPHAKKIAILRRIKIGE